jgi:hypothetical protein
MNIVFRSLSAALISCAPVIASAQAALAVGATQAPTLRTGLPIPMRNSAMLTTKGKELRVGQRVPLEVAEAVMLNGQVVIPVGSPGMGEITTVRNKGMWGKSGGITGRVLYVRVGDRQIRLSGSFDDKGVTGTVGVVAAIAFIPVAGFFTTGTSAVIPAGAPISAFLDEDVPVAFGSSTMTQPTPQVEARPPVIPAASSTGTVQVAAAPKR